MNWLELRHFSMIAFPEDFILTKLARPDRGAIDEQDLKSVLVRQADNLDEAYLEKRAQNMGVLAVLKTIQIHELVHSCGHFIIQKLRISDMRATGDQIVNSPEDYSSPPCPNR